MKEIKGFGKGYILLSALDFVLGIVLLAWPTDSVRMISYVLSISMIVLGITHGLIYFTRDQQKGILQMDLVIGIVCLALGAFLLLNPAFFATVLPFAMGVILLLDAVAKIQSAVNMKRLMFSRWYIVLICGIFIIILAIVLLCNLIKDQKWLVIYIGICMIFDGLTNLVSMICIQLRVKKLNKIQQKNPDVPYDRLIEQEFSDTSRGIVVPYRESGENRDNTKV